MLHCPFFFFGVEPCLNVWIMCQLCYYLLLFHLALKAMKEADLMKLRLVHSSETARVRILLNEDFLRRFHLISTHPLEDDTNCKQPVMVRILLLRSCVHYTTHTTNMEIHKRVALHIGIHWLGMIACCWRSLWTVWLNSLSKWRVQREPWQTPYYISISTLFTPERRRPL